MKLKASSTISNNWLITQPLRCFATTLRIWFLCIPLNNIDRYTSKIAQRWFINIENMLYQKESSPLFYFFLSSLLAV